jgi:transcriptional regulator with XRE-family HTH domain
MPHHVDVHVGLKIRQCRWTLGMSQRQLGGRIGISLGEMQRFETGEKAVGVSTLWEIATALNVPITHFFEGIEGPAGGDSELRAAILLEREAMELVRAFYGLPAGQRKGLLDLAHTLRNAAK